MKRFNVVWGLEWGSRRKQRRHPLTASILILAMIAQVGCASSGSGTFVRMSTHDLFPNVPDTPEEVVPPPPEATVRLGFDKMAVTSGRFAPTFDIVDVPSKNTPQTSECTYKGQEGLGCALKGLLVTEITFFLFVPLMAVELITETVKAIRHGYPVETTEPAVKVEERKVRAATARELIASQGLQDDLRDRVVAISRVHHILLQCWLTKVRPLSMSDQAIVRCHRRAFRQYSRSW